jgi:hypothetical protein
VGWGGVGGGGTPRQMLAENWSNTDQIFRQYWPSTGKYWSNTGQIMVKYLVNTGQSNTARPLLHWAAWSLLQRTIIPKTGQILVKYWANTGQLLPPPLASGRPCLRVGIGGYRRSNTGQILVKHWRWSNTGQIPVKQ